MTDRFFCKNKFYKRFRNSMSVLRLSSFFGFTANFLSIFIVIADIKFATFHVCSSTKKYVNFNLRGRSSLNSHNWEML